MKESHDDDLPANSGNLIVRGILAAASILCGAFLATGIVELLRLVLGVVR